MKEELKEKVRRIKADRSIVRVIGVCDLCKDEDVSILDDVLRLTFIIREKGKDEETELVLCNIHEGVLIQRLLKPYLKRIQCSPKRRDKKMGFKGEVPKDFPGEEEGEEPSAMEKLQGVHKSFLMEGVNVD